MRRNSNVTRATRPTTKETGRPSPTKWRFERISPRRVDIWSQTKPTQEGCVTYRAPGRRSYHSPERRADPGCWLPQRPYDGVVDAPPNERTLCARSHADERVSLRKMVRARTLHGFACVALALARAREGDFARVPTQILQDKNIHCVYDPHSFPAPCTLPRDDSYQNTGIPLRSL